MSRRQSHHSYSLPGSCRGGKRIRFSSLVELGGRNVPAADHNLDNTFRKMTVRRLCTTRCSAEAMRGMPDHTVVADRSNHNRMQSWEQPLAEVQEAGLHNTHRSTRRRCSMECPARIRSNCIRNYTRNNHIHHSSMAPEVRTSTGRSSRPALRLVSLDSSQEGIRRSTLRPLPPSRQRCSLRESQRCHRLDSSTFHISSIRAHTIQPTCFHYCKGLHRVAIHVELGY